MNTASVDYDRLYSIIQLGHANIYDPLSCGSLNRVNTFIEFGGAINLHDIIMVLELASTSDWFYIHEFTFRNSSNEIMICVDQYINIMQNYGSVLEKIESDLGINLFGKCTCSEICQHQLTYRPSSACHVSVQRELLLREIFHRDIASVIRKKMI